MADARTETEKATSREAQLARLGINKPGKSLSEIAAMMEENRRKMHGTDTPPRRPAQPNRVAAQTTDEEELEDDLEADNSEDEEEIENEAEGEEEESEGEEEESEGGEGEDEDGEEDDGFTELDISDDDLLQLEGFDEPVSFKQLRDVYNADRAVVEKVKQAEEQYSTAFNTANTAVTQAQEMQAAMQELVKGLEQSLMTPLITKPDEALKQTDPQRYIQHFDAYQQDQERIQATREQIFKALDEHANKSKETKTQLRQAEIGRLVQKLEPLRDEKTKKQASQDILAAAEHYGFSPEEVNTTADHRMFLMAYDAMQYRKLKGLSKEEKEERTTKIKKQVGSQPRVMRSRGTSKSMFSSDQKRVKVLKAKAAKSKDPNDLAAFMAASRKLRQAT